MTGQASNPEANSARAAFEKACKTEEKDGVRWVFRDEERAAADHWMPVFKRWLGRGRKAALAVTLFPDAAAKAKCAGSSRPADLFQHGASFQVDIDASATGEPDLVSPVLAAAALAAENPALYKRPLLLAAAGVLSAGRWWGREVVTFGAFAKGADVEPSVADVIASAPELSPVIAVGTAASWLGAGARIEGEAVMRKTLAGPEPLLSAALERWRTSAGRQAVSPPPHRELPGGFLRGVSYPTANSIDGGYVSSRSGETLRRLAALSVNSVAIIPFAFGRDPQSPEIDFIHRDPQGQTDEGIVHAVTDARAAGMTAMVKPQIGLGGGAFVGTIGMKTEEDWARWFDAYRRFIVHHAVVSEAAGAALYCVGTELSGTELHAKEWRRTIAAVRLSTGAPLTYAVSRAANAQNVTFWDALDAVGVDFYDPLSKEPKVKDAALEGGVRAAVKPLLKLNERVRKPVIFTEAGYPPVRGAWITPHDDSSGRPRSPEDAARSILAVFRALDSEKWWKGVYWWKASSDGRPSRPDDSGFNLLGTPSEKAVADGFARMARR